MRRTVVAILVAAALAGQARAQDDGDPTPRPAPTGEVEDAPPEKPAPKPAPAVVPVSGVRYRVLLKTGREIVGVVRARAVFERPTVNFSYVPADQDDPGAGIRLWFPGNQDGFVFLDLKEVGEIEELGVLTEAEGREIAMRRHTAQEKALQEREALRRRREQEAAAAVARLLNQASAGADAKPADTESGSGTGDPAQEKPKLTDADREALLLSFPPTRWTAETPAEIERRKVVLGLFPSEEERRFLEVFADWKIAFDAWEAAKKTATSRSDS